MLVSEGVEPRLRLLLPFDCFESDETPGWWMSEKFDSQTEAAAAAQYISVYLLRQYIKTNIKKVVCFVNSAATNSKLPLEFPVPVSHPSVFLRAP